MAFIVSIVVVNIYLALLYFKGPLRLKKLLKQSKAWQVAYMAIASFAFPQLISMFVGLGVVSTLMVLDIKDPFYSEGGSNTLVYALVLNNILAIILAFVFNSLWIFDKKITGKFKFL